MSELRIIPVVFGSKHFIITDHRMQYAYASVPRLAEYNIVLMRCECYNTRQLLIFCRLFGDNPMYMSDMSGNTYVRGSYLVDWSSDEIGVRWVKGTSALANNVYVQQVYGIL